MEWTEIAKIGQIILYKIKDRYVVQRPDAGQEYSYWFLNYLKDAIKCFENFISGQNTNDWLPWGTQKGLPDDAPKKVLVGGGNPPHKVAQGDTLAIVAFQYGVSIQKLRELNPKVAKLKDEDLIDKNKIPEIYLPKGATKQNLNFDWGPRVNQSPQNSKIEPPSTTIEINQALVPKEEEIKPVSDVVNSENTGIVNPSTSNRVNQPLLNQITNDQIQRDWEEKEKKRLEKEALRRQLFTEEYMLKPYNDEVARENGSKLGDKQTNAIDNARVDKPFLAPDWSQLEPDRSKQGWFEIAGEIVIGFTPAGVIVDTKDFIVALASGSMSEICMAGVGFLPFGDFFDAYKKAKKGADGIFEQAMKDRYGDNFDPETFDESFFKNPNNQVQGIGSFPNNSNPNITNSNPNITNSNPNITNSNNSQQTNQSNSQQTNQSNSQQTNQNQLNPISNSDEVERQNKLKVIDDNKEVLDEADRAEFEQLTQQGLQIPNGDVATRQALDKKIDALFAKAQKNEKLKTDKVKTENAPTYTTKYNYKLLVGGKNSRREVTTKNNRTIILNSGHGYDRAHAGGDIRLSGLSKDEIEDAIVDELDVIDITKIPAQGKPPFYLELKITAQNGYNFKARVNIDANNVICVSTYFP